MRSPDYPGLDVIGRIRGKNRDVRILVLTLHKEEDLVCRAFIAGADGYLLKDDLLTDLFAALGEILKSNTDVSPSAAAALENAWLKIFIASKGSHTVDDLSSLELEVLELLAKGVSSSGIASALKIEEQTVGNYHAAIVQKLHLEGTAAVLR